MTFAPWTTCARLLPPVAPGACVGFAAIDTVGGRGIVGLGGGTEGAATAGPDMAAGGDGLGGADGEDGRVAAAGAAVGVALVAAGLAGMGGGGFGAPLGTAAAAGWGRAVGAGVGGVAGAIERSSSQIAAHTPHVWILLVEALQA